MKYIKLFRVKHYIKNLLIYLPLVFSGHLLDGYLFLKTTVGVCSFSLICSVIYIINDIKDVEKDRLHPTKKERPIAAGTISEKLAIVLAAVSFLVAMAIGLLFFGKQGSLCLITYAFLNVLYSVKLKEVPIIDIALLVSGFFLRVLFGSVITGITISPWLFLTVIAISFYLALGKRRNEIRMNDHNNDATRTVLSFYNYAFLDKNMYTSLAIAIAFYAMWAADNPINEMLWTVPLVIIISMKYSLIVEGESEGDPVEVILNDKLLLLLLLVYAITVFGLLYIF